MLIVCAALLICTVASTQAVSRVITDKGYLFATFGPAIPVGDFGSSNLSANEHAGYARTGLSINLQGACHLTPHYSFRLTAFYGRHQTDNISTPAGEITSNRWQYFGVVAGPMFRIPLAPHLYFDVAALTGFSDVNSPLSSMNGGVINEDWSLTAPLKGEAALRYHFADGIQLLLGADFLSMRPKFKVHTEGNSFDKKQNMDVVNVYGGIGISF